MASSSSSAPREPQRMASTLHLVEQKEKNADKDKKTGVALFSDVFRRADKNDDGKMSLEEFSDYFKDDLLADSDLKEIFRQIDANNAHFLSLDDLFNYFNRDFGPFTKLFSHLEELHTTVSQTLNSLSKPENYAQLDFYQQFKIRFFLREFEAQIGTLQQPVRAAIEGLESQSATIHKRSIVQESGHVDHHDVLGDSSSTLSPQPGVGLAVEMKELREQVSKLAKIVSKLENAPIQLEKPEEDIFNAVPHDPHFVVSRKMKVLPEKESNFQKAMKHYCKATRREDGCYHVYISKHQDTYFLYEIWEKESFYEQYYSSQAHREFAKVLVDYLARPEELSTMYLPASWWPDTEE